MTMTMNKEAKYTEYLGDYLKTHTLPESMGLIEDFDDLFVATFVDREIGFETEYLFEIKLSAKSSLVMPLYKHRLNKLTAAWEDVDDAAKTITEATQEATADTLNVAAQKSTVTDLPLNTTEALPNSEQKTDAYINTSARNYSRNFTRSESGVTTPEAYDVIERLQRDVYKLLDNLLQEFEPLFMGIF